jgi:predicted ATP-binding protein involved in virulence
MKLNSLTLQNFRCFEHLELDLHPQLTVLISENGGGKTAVLDAIRVILSPFTEEFNNTSYVIDDSDINFLVMKNKNIEFKFPCVVSLYMVLIENLRPQVLYRDRKDIYPNRKVDEKIYDFLDFIKESVANKAKKINLSLIRHFDTGRIWGKKKFTSVAKEVEFENKDFSRLSVYSDCLSSEVNFSEFASWFGWVNRSYREEQMDAQEEGVPLSEDGKRFLTIIKAIQGAVDSITKETTGWHSLQYRSSQNKQLVMRHDENGFIPVEMLSDGIRNTIAMVADIAYRACKLNPHLGINAAKETDGIVLIDEVDMFLHPKWQQTILKSLTDAFPKMQFIVTTHSPQVLSTVRRENIRILPEGKMPEFSPLAHESGDALAKIMNTPKQPPIELMDTVRAFEQLVRAGKEETEEAKKLRQMLDEKGYQIHESDLTTWRFLAKRKAQKGA